MYKQHVHKILLLASLAILFLISTIPALAQTDDSVELEGIIEDMTSTTITINQQVIDISNAELNVSFELGSLIKIEGSLSTSGQITAREVNAPDEGAQAGESELTGILESFDGSTMVINGQVVDVSTAEVKTGIIIGELVKVHVTANDDGTWQAREAEPATMQDDTTTDDNSSDDNSDDGLQPGEFEIIGTLDEIGDGFVVVSSQTIDVNTAEIKNLLITGVLVKVHLSNVDGSFVAREIENHTGSDDSSVDDDNTNANANTNTNTNTNANTNANTNSNTATAVSIEDVSSTVLSIYPNTTITEIELDDDFGDKLIWKVETSHGIELKIDAQTGVILTIEREGDNNTNNNVNTNANTNSANSNVDDNGGSNNNSNNAGNNNNSNSNSNSNSNDNDDDDDDDNSGMGSDDDRDDDDDDDDNSGMGSDDDDDDD